MSIIATETATLLAQSTRHDLALETLLEEVNDRLKEAKRRVRVVVPSKRHRTLHLRATLPAMPEIGPFALIAVAAMPDLKTRRILRLIAEKQGVPEDAFGEVQQAPETSEPTDLYPKLK